MKEFEGTQGAWRVKNNGILTEVVSGDTTIATFFNKYDLSAAKANAQLIATAPELLEALQKAICYVPIDEEDFDDFARVINKALGE